MAEKKKEKKTGRPRKAAGAKDDAKDTGGRKHPEQQRAEREEEQTIREREPGERESPGAEVGERPASEEQKEPERVGPSRRAMEEGEFPVVAIGASAGGLEALEGFFSALPADSGISFVVITHTDPKHGSLLPELIRRKSKVPVQLIEDGMALEPDTVYLAPSHSDPVLEQGVFRLEKRPESTKLHMPVDLFLRYLAQDRGELAGCVILSGTGTDGTQGLRLIKEKAGVTVAQTPDSAQHSGMPKSAMETGLVDYLLPPPRYPSD